MTKSPNHRTPAVFCSRLRNSSQWQMKWLITWHTWPYDTLDLGSFKLHVATVNYQTYIYLAFDKPHAPPQPTGHGWTLQNGMCVPLRYTEEALPRSLHA